MSFTAAHIGLLRQAITAAEATCPKPVAQALADQATLAAGVAAIRPASAEEIADAVAECVLTGRDPLDDEQVRRLTTARDLTGDTGRALTYSVQLAGERRILAALEAHVDTIVATLCKAANNAGQEITGAHEVIGDYDLEDTANVIRRGDKASAAWNTARAALKQLRTLDNGWVALANLTRFASADYPTLRIAELSLDQHDHIGRKAEPWDLVRAGITIDMADRDAMRDRIERVTTEREQRDSRQSASFGNEYRRTHGMGSTVA